MEDTFIAPENLVAGESYQIYNDQRTGAFEPLESSEVFPPILEYIGPNGGEGTSHGDPMFYKSTNKKTGS